MGDQRYRPPDLAAQEAWTNVSREYADPFDVCRGDDPATTEGPQLPNAGRYGNNAHILGEKNARPSNVVGTLDCHSLYPSAGKLVTLRRLTPLINLSFSSLSSFSLLQQKYPGASGEIPFGSGTLYSTPLEDQSRGTLSPEDEEEGG